MSETSIVPNLTLPEAVALYRECMSDLRKGFDLINSVDQRLKAFGDYCFVPGGDKDEWRFRRFDEPDLAIASIERKVWEAIVSRMGIR